MINFAITLTDTAASIQIPVSAYDEDPKIPRVNSMRRHRGFVGREIFRRDKRKHKLADRNYEQVGLSGTRSCGNLFEQPRWVGQNSKPAWKENLLLITNEKCFRDIAPRNPIQQGYYMGKLTGEGTWTTTASYSVAQLRPKDSCTVLIHHFFSNQTANSRAFVVIQEAYKCVAEWSTCHQMLRKLELLTIESSWKQRHFWLSPTPKIPTIACGFLSSNEAPIRPSIGVWALIP